MRPMEQFMNPFDAVFVPVLSRLQDQPERYRRAFLQVFGGMAMSGFPFAALLYSLASPIVLLLFGPQWKDVIPIFEAFSLSALFIPLVFATTWLLTTQGRTKDILKAGIIASVVSVGSFAVGLPFGPAGVALAYSIGGLLVRMPLHFRLVGQAGPVTSVDLWTIVLKQIWSFVLIVAVIYGIRKLNPSWTHSMQLIVCVPIGLVIGASLILVIPSQKRQIVDLVTKMIAELKRRRK